jgi:hypothetical protein
MIEQTTDVFILNGYVYWRYLWSEHISGPGYIKLSICDEFIKVDYKENIKTEITSEEFYDAFKTFENVKDVPEFIDNLMTDALERRWLSSILYTSSIMNF